MIDTRDCVAQIHHGRNYQIISLCTVEDSHDVHQCASRGRVLQWRGDVGCTDFNDEIPYINE